MREGSAYPSELKNSPQRPPPQRHTILGVIVGVFDSFYAAGYA
jgi:hypothetical protein